MTRVTPSELDALKAASDAAIAEAHAAALALNACLNGSGYFGIPSNGPERETWNQYNEIWKAANKRAHEATEAYITAAFEALEASAE